MSTASLAIFLRRMLQRGERAPVSRRVEVCPPAMLARAASAPGWRASLRDWLDTGWARPAGRTLPPQQRPASDPLGAVRAEFLQSVSDIRTQQAGMLGHRVRVARSLQELWHLRPEVFKLVALRYSQYEAQTRLDRLNRHFPTRAPRSGFGSFEPGSDTAPRRPARQR
ncbi:MAG: hypothetical protein IAE86_13715 [Burkholderiaceae bacterium]|nr:hypothetical protein [Burkholderiaceae bacterium]